MFLTPFIIICLCVKGMNNKIKFWLFLIATYILCEVLVYILSKNNFMKSAMYLFLPIVGFIGMYFATPVISQFIKINKLTVLVLFAMLSLIAFYVALYFFFWNYLKVLNNLPISFNYIKTLTDSAYLEFIIAGIIGVIASDTKNS
jgi:hypothetical protein